MIAWQIVKRIEEWTWTSPPLTWLSHTVLLLWGVYLPVRGFSTPTVAWTVAWIGVSALVLRELFDAFGGKDTSPWWDHVMDALVPAVGLFVFHTWVLS